MPKFKKWKWLKKGNCCHFSAMTKCVWLRHENGNFVIFLFIFIFCIFCCELKHNHDIVQYNSLFCWGIFAISVTDKLSHSFTMSDTSKFFTLYLSHNSMQIAMNWIWKEKLFCSFQVDVGLHFVFFRKGQIGICKKNIWLYIFTWQWWHFGFRMM